MAVRENMPNAIKGAIEALRGTTGLDAEIVTPAKRMGPEVDAVVDIIAEGKHHRYLIECKQVDRAPALGLIKDRFERLQQPGLLVAPYITPDLAEHCRKLDIPFIDTAGNAFLHGPGFFLFVKGQRKPEEARLPAATKAGTATALRVVFVLLCQPRFLNAPYRQIVDAAHVALGAVGWVFFDLNGRGFVAGAGKTKDRRFIEPKKLLDEWVTNYPIKLRPKLNPRRFTAANQDWWKKTDIARFGALWGGEVAADRLTGHLKPAQYTLYMKPEDGQKNLTKLIATNRLRADPKGDIEVLDAFWDFPPDPQHPDVVPPVLVYADLVATLDPRNLEVARLVYKQHIEHAFRQI